MNREAAGALARPSIIQLGRGERAAMAVLGAELVGAVGMTIPQLLDLANDLERTVSRIRQAAGILALARRKRRRGSPGAAALQLGAVNHDGVVRQRTSAN